MPIILCLDPGTAHTGLAISREGILAEPLETIFERKTNSLVSRLVPYIARFNPDIIVVGTPSYGPLVKVAQDIAEKLPSVFSGKIELFNEDLSSKEAGSKMRQSKKTIRQIKTAQHQTAAAIVLQRYLDEQQ